MKLKRFSVALLLLFCVFSVVQAQKLGRTVRKEITINGEKISKRMKYDTLKEYNPDGKLIHSYVPKEGEEWHEYDSNGNEIYFKRSNSDIYEEGTHWNKYDSSGNMIHSKYSDGSEFWFEYDEKGNKIHSKCFSKSYNNQYTESSGFFHGKEKWEEWYEYDSNRNNVHSTDSLGGELWKEYDSNGNKIHSKRSDGYEFWYEYDENGNMIHYHSKHYEDYLKKFFYTDTWYEYDENGNRTHELNSPGSECWRKYDSKGNLIYYKQDYGYVKYECEYEHQYNSQGNIIYTKINTGEELWYEYEYYPDGKIKTEKRFELKK